MELKEFIQRVITEIMQAVEEADKTATREVKLHSTPERRTIEFDVALTVEETSSGGGGAKLKVFSIFEGSGGVVKETKNTTVHRITFGVDVNPYTKQQLQEWESRNEAYRNSIKGFNKER